MMALNLAASKGIYTILPLEQGGEEGERDCQGEGSG